MTYNNICITNEGTYGPHYETIMQCDTYTDDSRCVVGEGNESTKSCSSRISWPASRTFADRSKKKGNTNGNASTLPLCVWRVLLQCLLAPKKMIRHDMCFLWKFYFDLSQTLTTFFSLRSADKLSGDYFDKFNRSNLTTWFDSIQNV